MLGLQQLDERVTGGESGDARAVTVAEWDFGEAKHVAKERNGVAKCAHGETEVRNAGAAR